jgi:hypothetical protein
VVVVCCERMKSVYLGVHPRTSQRQPDRRNVVSARNHHTIYMEG